MTPPHRQAVPSLPRTHLPTLSSSGDLIDQTPHKPNELLRSPRHRASGVSHLPWQCGPPLLLDPPKSLATETRRKYPEVREVRYVWVLCVRR